VENKEVEEKNINVVGERRKKGEIEKLNRI
jgi:hypothetical protein